MDSGRPEFEFLAGGGEMGARTRAFDWSGTSIGAPETWPQSLRVTVRVILNTRHPMFIWWGPDLIQFYNDSYAETMGPERHPSALGAHGRDCWEEIWPVIGPQIDYVMAGKGSTWDEERRIEMTRNGRKQDVWWTYSYGPIDVEGGVGGVLVVCNDVTAQVQAKDALAHQTRFLEQLFEQAPSFMAVLEGPDHVFRLSNAAYQRLVGTRELTGKPVRDALPEIEGQGFLDLLDEVYRSGEPHIGKAVPLTLRIDSAPPRDVFVDFIYQPIRDQSGAIVGIFVEGVDVSDHVQAERHLRMINLELTHRVKNTLAIVSAIASQTLRGLANEGGLKSFQERLRVFGTAHDILAAANKATVSIKAVVEGALAAFDIGKGRLRISGPDLMLGSKQSLSLALALNELATNAIKYGALSNKVGEVRIEWREEDGGSEPQFQLSWREINGPPVSVPLKTGFGSQLVQRGLAADFGGTVELSYDRDGVVCRLTAPMAHLRFAQPFYDKLN
ncbi:sensor histidine kinase [Bosea lathyri]|uniref:histidine kinase n=1 Tax=Bosea lathyri TaxID=1036778 RepID=A0A1H6AS24_9HYPH|nr:PAS domain-containing protein [Bosea lathyri]SEG51488.1 Two-component sensor histidine kinase, contains HisKA and HATPase domains [Bosea lathyri]